MIFGGHLGAGYITAYAVLKSSAVASAGAGAGALSQTQINSLLVSGTLIGILPDIDILFFLVSNKTFRPGKLGHHRGWVHAPLYWLLAGLAIYFVADLFLSGSIGAFWELFGLLFWLCSWSHFVCDSIYNSPGGGIAWLWPLYKKPFSLFYSKGDKEHYYSSWVGLVKSHIGDPLTYLEALILIGAVWLFLFHW